MTRAQNGWSSALDSEVNPSTREGLWRLSHELTGAMLEGERRSYLAKDQVLGHQALLRAFPAEKRAAFPPLETDLYGRVFSPGDELTARA